MNVVVSTEGVIQFSKHDNGLFMVKGLVSGSVDIKIDLKYKETQKVITSIVIDARVEMIDGVEILGMIDRKLYVGAIFRLIALGI